MEALQQEWVDRLISEFPTGLTPEQKSWLKIYETVYVTGMKHFLKTLKGEPSTLPDDPLFCDGWEDALLSVKEFYRVYGFPPKSANPREDYEMSCEKWRIWTAHRKLWLEMYTMVRGYQMKYGTLTIAKEIIPRLKRRNARDLN
jgi:hypothetical protein